MRKNKYGKQKPPVHVSQNFLTSSIIIRRLINRTNLMNNDTVIEIGPGKDHITNALLGRCAPFNHTTDIVRKLTKCKNPPSDAWLVMEKGAAKRFMGRPYENVLSMAIKKKYDLDIIYYFRREDFHPLPGVDIVMLQMKKKYKK